MGTANVGTLCSAAAIAICGRSGSGKSTSLRAAANLPMSTLVSFGDYVRHIADAQSIARDRFYLQELGDRTIKEIGVDQFLSNAIIFATRGSGDSTLYLFDGVRHFDVWSAIQRLFKRAFLIGLECSEETRRERLRSRDSLDERQTERIISHKMDQAIEELLTSADFTINSDRLPIEMIERVVRSTCEAVRSDVCATAQ